MRRRRSWIVAFVLLGCVTPGNERRGRGRDGGSSPQANAPECECEDGADASTVGHHVGPTGSPRRGGTLVICVRNEPPHLQYMLLPLTVAMGSLPSGHDLFESLVRLDPRTFEPTPELAESWQMAPDGRLITFHLRRGVRWHDGQGFTSRDVAFTFERLMDPTHAIAQRADFDFVQSWSTPDPHTFVLRLRTAHFSVLERLDRLHVLPGHVYARGDFQTHPAHRHPIGTGPFRMKHWTAGSEIVVSRNPDYWGAPPWLDRVEYRIVREQAVAFELLRRGEVDLMTLPSDATNALVNALTDAEAREHVREVVFSTLSTRYWAWNTSRPQLRDPRVRRALGMLVNRPLIRCAVLGCQARIASQIFPFGTPSHDPGIRPLPFAPDRARALLSEAGWRDSDGDGIRDKRIGGTVVQLRIRYLTIAQPVYRREAVIVQNEMRRAGVEMAIEEAVNAVLATRAEEGDFDVINDLLQADGPLIDPYAALHSSTVTTGSNTAHWRSVEADRILEATRQELDPARRNGMLRRLSALMHEEQPWLFLFQNPVRAFLSDRVRGAEVSPLGFQIRDIWLDR